MAKQNNTKPFKFRFPRIFTSSSCKTQTPADIIHHKHHPLELQRHQKDLNFFHSTPFEPLSPPNYFKPTRVSSNCSSICKPRCPKCFDEMVLDTCIVPKSPFSRRKISFKTTPFQLFDDFSGLRCPPVSPLNQYKKRRKKKKTQRRKKKNNTQMKKTQKRDLFDPFYSSSDETDGFFDWFSSEDEREFNERNVSKSFSFSSKSVSLSSDSESHHTYAVVKRSKDPYRDFRKSMVEMIMEKQIFGVKELEGLLDCFLSLNSEHHHGVIVEVFSEILDALFSHLS